MRLVFSQETAVTQPPTPLIDISDFLVFKKRLFATCLVINDLYAAGSIKARTTICKPL